MHRFLILLLLMVAAGCQTVPELPAPKTDPLPKTDVVMPDAEDPVPRGFPHDLSDVRFLHRDVSRWPQTAVLKAVTLSGSSITLDYDKAGVWPSGTYQSGGPLVNANPLIIVKHQGEWLAATWEWLRPGQVTKAKSAVRGDHIKKAPLHDFSPVAGETYWFMVAGLCRDATTTVQERSNWVEIIWK